MKITFTHDFQGKLTGPYFYAQGETAEIEDEIAAELITLGHAVAAEPVAVEEPEPATRVDEPDVETDPASFFAEPPVDPPNTDNPPTEKGKRHGKPA